MADFEEAQRRIQQSLAGMMTPDKVARHFEAQLDQIDFTNPNWTSEILKNVVRWIRQFDATLDEQHEIGVRLVNFGQVVQFYLEEITCCESPLMLFRGRMEDGTPVDLIQHVSQISILLMKLPKRDPEAPRQKIGFHTEKTDDPQE